MKILHVVLSYVLAQMMHKEASFPNILSKTPIQYAWKWCFMNYITKNSCVYLCRLNLPFPSLTTSLSFSTHLHEHDKAY
jgi:hypothetical protein